MLHRWTSLHPIKAKSLQIMWTRVDLAYRQRVLDLVLLLLSIHVDIMPA
jgi:hypothetical protein